jgi:acetylornithine/succinyldiaminopimelate/putrescine aminotransferase
MWGVEFKSNAGPVVTALRARGILATRAGDSVVRLLPPLVIKRSEVQSLLVALDAVLASGVGLPVEGGGGGAVA